MGEMESEPGFFLRKATQTNKAGNKWRVCKAAHPHKAGAHTGRQGERDRPVVAHHGSGRHDAARPDVESEAAAPRAASMMNAGTPPPPGKRTCEAGAVA